MVCRVCMFYVAFLDSYFYWRGHDGSGHPIMMIVYWVAVKEFKLSYHNYKTILFTIYPYCGNLN